jgi:hypothetical protein
VALGEPAERHPRKKSILTPFAETGVLEENALPGPAHIVDRSSLGKTVVILMRGPISTCMRINKTISEYAAGSAVQPIAKQQGPTTGNFEGVRPRAQFLK